MFAAAVPAVAQDPPEAVKKVGSYVFKPIEIKPSPNGTDYEGRFLFINKESSPVEINGFGEPRDGKFEPWFVEFQTLKDGKWEKIPVGYCGLPESFPMRPGMEYEFLPGLWSFKEQDSPLTGRIGVDDYWSEPFVLDWKKDRSAGKFDLAKKEHFAKLRSQFAKAGFKKELLSGDDFCSRLIQAMMKETTAKGMADSFHRFLGNVDVTPGIRLNGSIRIDFQSDEVRDFDNEFTGWFVLDPGKFSAQWFRKAVKQHVKAGEWGDGVQMELDDGSNFDAPFYLCIKYEPFDHAERPSKETSEELFRSMLRVMDGWLK